MKVRSATLTDVSLIFSFIKKKSEFDRSIGAFSGKLRVSEEKLRQTLFGAIPFSYVLFAKTSEREVGFALYGFRYSSFSGQPSIWLDDLYVDEEMRSQGAGAVLMSYLAQVAKENDCTHLAWNADARNTRGLSFISSVGRRNYRAKRESMFFDLDSMDITLNLNSKAINVYGFIAFCHA